MVKWLNTAGTYCLYMVAASSARLFDQVIALLKEANAVVTELAGVEPNPRLSTVHVALCREHNIDLILAVGGGSVLTAPRPSPLVLNTTEICGISSNAKPFRKRVSTWNRAYDGDRIEMNGGSVTNEVTQRRWAGEALCLPCIFHS